MDGDEVKNIYGSVDGVESKGFEIELDGKLMDKWDMSFGVVYFNVEDVNGKKV